MTRFNPKSFLQDFILRYRLPLLSGVLFGLSWPYYPYLPTELLAWVWMVPLFSALKAVTEFRPFMRRVLAATLVASLMNMSWLSLANVTGAAALCLLGAAKWAVPFVVFYFLRRGLGWRVALWSSPAVWTAVDWLYHHSEGSIGWLALGITQARMWWLVQFADLTGMWGVTFWVALFNVLLTAQFADFAKGLFQGEAAPREGEIGWKHVIRHPHPAIGAGLALMLVLPAAYTGFVFLSQPSGDKQLSVLLMQPNTDPWRQTNETTNAQALGRATALTNRALRQASPSLDPAADLILWPEGAVPFLLSREADAREFLSRQVERWQTPLLTGAPDARTYADPDERSPLLKFHGADTEFFNAAFLLSPDLEGSGPSRKKTGFSSKAVTANPAVGISEPYRKRTLMPFAERVPFADRLPALSKLALDFNLPYSLTPGSEARVFRFNDRQGQSHGVGVGICYEQFYPEQLAEQVRGGAELMAFITNIGWFSQSQGQYEISAFARIRAIELRRAIAIAANTGQTCLIDPFGRMTAAAPWWSEQTLLGQVRLSSALSFYVRHPHWLPKLCLLLTPALGSCLAVRRLRRRFGNPRGHATAQRISSERGFHLDSTDEALAPYRSRY